MELLKELVSIKRMDNILPAEQPKPQQKYKDDDILNMLQHPGQEQQGQNTPELDSIVDQATENPDRQGLIRTIDGAHLVFKRQSNDGSFEELWVYKNSTLRDELEIRNAILAGTDIPINQLSSPDGKQKYHVWSSGNIEMLHVIGLPN